MGTLYLYTISRLEKALIVNLRVSSCWLDFKNSILDSQNGDIKSSTSKIEDENVALSFGLLWIWKENDGQLATAVFCYVQK